MSAGSDRKMYILNPEVYKWIEEWQNDPGNQNVQTKICLHYEPLVKSMAGKFSNGHVLHEDLVQVGMIGLLAAAKRYDPAFHKSFEAFAIPTIVGEIKRYIRDKTWSVHVPRRIKELGPKIKHATELLTNELGRSPKIEEIAEYLGVSEEEVLETMEIGKSYQALSVDGTFENDQGKSAGTLLDNIGYAEKGYEEIDRSLLIKNALQSLSERERFIIQCIYFEQKSQRETGDLLGISQMHVSRLQKRALIKLREVLHMELSEVL